MNVLYTTEALATGDGRDGRVRSDDGRIDLDLAVPKQMGGSCEGANPEQLFAAGYAVCFHSALRMVARQAKVNVEDSSVGAAVGIGTTEAGGFGLQVTLEVTLPHISRDQAQSRIVLASGSFGRSDGS